MTAENESKALLGRIAFPDHAPLAEALARLADTFRTMAEAQGENR